MYILIVITIGPESSLLDQLYLFELYLYKSKYKIYLAYNCIQLRIVFNLFVVHCTLESNIMQLTNKLLCIGLIINKI